MTIHRPISGETSKGVLIGAGPRSLAAIESQDCAAAIWQREPLQAFQDWIDALSPSELPKARVILRPGDARQAMTDLFDTQSIAPCQERAMLIDDVAALAYIFASIMQVPFVRLRLDAITGNAHRDFHTDRITARLICTYRGPGTQYGVSENGDDPERVLTAPTGSPIVLRGHLWPASAATQVVQRFSPLEGRGEGRLVLLLDPVTDQPADSREHFLH
ncbi:MAG: DUF1826 domain-containing protein [Pseudomonadota bacterium]